MPSSLSINGSLVREVIHAYQESRDSSSSAPSVMEWKARTPDPDLNSSLDALMSTATDKSLFHRLYAVTYMGFFSFASKFHNYMNETSDSNGSNGSSNNRSSSTSNTNSTISSYNISWRTSCILSGVFLALGLIGVHISILVFIWICNIVFYIIALILTFLIRMVLFYAVFLFVLVFLWLGLWGHRFIVYKYKRARAEGRASDASDNGHGNMINSSSFIESSRGYPKARITDVTDDIQPPSDIDSVGDRNSLVFTFGDDVTQEQSQAVMSRPTSSTFIPSLCILCGEGQVSRVFRPCGHVVCCKTCARTMHVCPKCNAEIEKRKKLPQDILYPDRTKRKDL